MKFKYLLTLPMAMLVGCNSANSGGNSSSSANLQDVQLRHSINAPQSRELSLHLQLDSNRNIKSVPITYYLISEKETKVRSFENENNLTTISEPLSQYRIGSDLIDLHSNQIDKEKKITIRGNIPSGKYKLVAYIDPKNTKNLSIQNATSIIEDSNTIDLEPTIQDVSLLSAKLDDDLFLIDDDNVDGMLTATLSAKANVDNVSNLSLKACIDIDGNCIDLPFYSEDTTLSYSRPIRDLNEDVTNISVALKIPKSLKEKWYNSFDSTIHNANIKITLVSKLPNEPLKNNVQRVPLSLYKNSLQSRAVKRVPSSQGNVLLKGFSKGFNATKRDRRFGVKLSSDAYARFSMLDSDTGVKGGISVRILGKDISFFSANLKAVVEYDSFKNSGYSIVIQAFHKNIFLRDRNIYDTLRTTPPVAKLKEGEEKLPQAEQNKILTKRQIAINKDFESTFLLSYTKDFSVEKMISKEQQIMVSIVPVVVKAGAGGSVGFKASIGLDGILSLSSKIGPDANIGGFASGGVGVVGFNAGIEAKFTFIKNYFYADTNFSFLFSGDSNDLRLKGVLSEKVVNTFQGPNGTLDLYAQYTVPKICKKSIRYCVAINWKGHCTKHHTKTKHYPCGVKHMHPTKNLFRWDSKLSKAVTLLNESQTLTDNKIY